MQDTDSNDIFKSLNKAQSRAVSSLASTVAILAGPGSGKTHTLTSRVVWLIDHVGIQPCDVIVATFTVKASNEMKMRIGQALGDGREKKIVIGTFHSIARRYLARYGQHIGLDPKFGIADDSDSTALIKRICKRLDTQLQPAIVRSWISKRKAKGTSDEQAAAKNDKSVESQAMEQCFQEYQGYLERTDLLDYDDLLVRCVELLRKYPDCVRNIQTVLIDEYQDTNGIQYDLMKLFAQANRRITIVGDPDQSIYGWRSAEIKNLHRLLRDFPGTDEVSLEENYRSSSSILDASLKVIQQDQDRYKKVLLPIHEKCTRPVLRKLKSSTIEADWIVSEIKRVKLASGGGFKFFDRAEIKTLLDYLRVIHQPDNNDALARIMNAPKRGIGDVTAKSLLEEADRDHISLWELLEKHCRGERTAKTTIRKQVEQKISKSLIRLIEHFQKRLKPSEGTPVNLVDIIHELLKALQFDRHLEETYGPEYELRWANVQEFMNLVAEFVIQDGSEEEMLPIIEGAQQMSDDSVLARFLANVTLASEKQTDKDKGKPQVTVSTIHAAKGLEWPVVFIPAVYKGSIPHMRSDDENEERRLLYVAMTRAQALLYLSCPQYTATGGKDAAQISPFVDNLPSSTFLQKGPSFDRPMMSQVAKILRRELPPDSVIYKGMPTMEAVEDNLFPIDPTQNEQSSNGHGYSQRPGQYKRQKVQHTSVKVAEESVEGWAAPYATTMQRSASFTVPQPPPAQSGFTTAGAHYASVAATEAAKPKPATKPAQRAATKRPPNSRAPAQKDLLGYGYGVTNHDKSKQLDAPPAVPIKVNHAPRPYQLPRGYGRQPGSLGAIQARQSAAIEPTLANHKLGSAKLSSRPTASSASAEEKQQPSSKPKQYACFSSSPTKPELEAEKENEVPPIEEQTRPAHSFHATTVNRGPKMGWSGGGGGGIQRPAPLGRDGITPMDRLKRPFRPLTVKRPT
ncbi:hypothetical protein Hte_001677 [Hypoxylon texense]